MKGMKLYSLINDKSHSAIVKNGKTFLYLKTIFFVSILHNVEIKERGKIVFYFTVSSHFGYSFDNLIPLLLKYRVGIVFVFVYSF